MRQLLASVRSGLVLSIIALLVSAGWPAVARAVDVELFATSVVADPDAAGATTWTFPSRAAGNPNCSACQCDSLDFFAYNDPADGTYLHATNLNTFTLPAGHVITNVNADVMCRYDANTGGTVRLRYYLNGVDNAIGDFGVANDALTTCRYRAGAGGDLPVPAGGWTAAAVNSLELRIRRVGANSSRLRVKAFRIVVSYVAIDTDGDGTPDINDCAPTNPAIASPRTYYRDADGDGFGNANVTTSVCQTTPPAGYVSNSSDCNDADAGLNPNTVWYYDADDDGVGVSTQTVVGCAQPANYVRQPGDGCPTDRCKVSPGTCGCGVTDTDANGNGLADACQETGALSTMDFYATNVTSTAGAWRLQSAAEGNPSCGPCACDSYGAYAYNGNVGGPNDAGGSDESVLTGTFSIQVPSNKRAVAASADVLCRYDNGTTGQVRVGVRLNGAIQFQRQPVFASTTSCEYLLGSNGYLCTPAGGWTSASLSALSFQIQTIQTPSTNALRVRAMRIRVVMVEADDDHDGLTNSVDRCPTLVSSAACNAAGIACADVNGNGTLDACEGVTSWIGSTGGAFSTPTSWTSGAAPTAASSVYLSSSGGSTLTLSTASLTTIGSLNVTGGIVRLNLGANFAVTGNVTVAPGATLIVDGVTSNRFFDVAGTLRVQIGAKLEIGGLASVRGGTTGSMVTEALSTLNLTLRTNGSIPLALQGSGQFLNGIVLKLGSVGAADLTEGRQFQLVTVGNLIGSLFRSIGGQSTPDGKFLKSLGTGTFVGGTLTVQVAFQSQFVSQIGQSSQPLGAATIPTAIVARNFTSPSDQLDDIAVTARRYGAGGVEGPGSLFVFKSSGGANNTPGEGDVIEYATDAGPVAVESEDIDSDGDLDLLVLNTVAGSIQIFRNGTPPPPASAGAIDRFTTSAADRILTSVGDTYFAISRNTVPNPSLQMINTFGMLVSNPGGSTLRALVFSNGAPVKGNPVVVPNVGPPGPCSPLDDTGRTDGAFISSFRQGVNELSGSISTVHIAAGAGGLPEPQIINSLPGPNFPIDVEVANLNQDGFSDVLVAGVADSTMSSDPTIALYSGISIGGFDSPGSILLPQRPLDLAVGAFDSDTKSDFIVALGTANASGEQGDFARLYQNVVGTPGTPPAFEFSSGDNLFAGAGVRRLRRANLNNVGADDVAVMGETIGGGLYALTQVNAPFGGSRLLQVTALPPQCGADITGDRTVDGNDLALLLGSWGQNGIADLDGNDSVDGGDLTIMLSAWGICP